MKPASSALLPSNKEGKTNTLNADNSLVLSNLTKFILSTLYTEDICTATFQMKIRIKHFQVGVHTCVHLAV